MRKCLLVILVLLSTHAAFAADAPQVHGPDKTNRLAGLIGRIKHADQPEAAARAYAGACSIDRSSIDLHRAYMRRMLKFGLPQYAFHPAHILTRLDTANGLAWGVVVYRHGKGNKMHDALAAAIRAEETESDNPGILHNLGMLTAWREKNPAAKGKLPARLAESLDKRLDQWRRSDAFAGAHAKIVSAYEGRDKVKKKWDDKIAAAEAKLAPLREEVAKIRRELKKLEDDKKSHKRRLSRHKRDLRAVKAEIEEYEAQGKSTKHLKREASGLRDDIRRERDTIDKIDRIGSRLWRDGKAEFERCRKKQADIDKMQADGRKETAAAGPVFHWQPPAVDGAVTPQRKNFRASATQSAKGPDDAETRAAKLLKLARLYLKNDMRAKARELLKTIQKLYKNTAAAKEAKDLLEKLERKDR